MDPVRYDDFVVELFDRARTVEAIIAEANTKEFARVLKAGNAAGTSSILLDSYVLRIREAKRIVRGEKPWVSVFELFESRSRDIDAFRWVVQAETGDVAVDEVGGLYLSPELANRALYTDRQNLRSRNEDQRTVILVLSGVLILLALRAVFNAVVA